MEFNYNNDLYILNIENQKMYKCNDHSGIFHTEIKEKRTGLKCNVDFFIDNKKISYIAKEIKNNSKRFVFDFEQKALFIASKLAKQEYLKN
ncbi:TPA: hypothetical protein ACX6QN_003776 [Photobacterium damselae]